MERKSVERLHMKSKIFIFTFALPAMLLLSPNAIAGERYEFYNGIRSMGMGGTTVAIVNDETALIGNPAALGRLRDFFITVADPEIEESAETSDIIKYDVLKITDPQLVLDKCNLKPDKHMHVRAQGFPSVVVPNFGIGVFGKVVADADVNSETNKFTYNYTSDYALVAGLNFRIWDGIIKIGGNARLVNRTTVRRDDIATTETTLKLKDLAASGMGIGSDAGIIITAPIVALPTIAAVYRDVGDTSYKMRDGMFMDVTDRPDHTKGTLDAGLSLQPILGKIARSTFSAELMDTMNVDKEKDIMRRVHVGAEINLADTFFIRAGLNQRYWTAGFELSMFNYQFQVASYGEDIGPDETPKEDRRYEAKFAFRF
jgi:hypothetical protein